ncbi:unnamed protein product [Eruca vesicaria subsp. sativa]|uniref:Phototropic-responsive NPH3 family protein n=1 Tax=Eruca vesicaria subsp. sativa TaxID=29727 RepID=A0ABC8LPM6_ERUVS|nr:unnamed protein product [Eruca vesicaria subsp. sativa]
MGAEKQSSKKQAWFCTTGLSSDMEVEIDDMIYHLNKFLLMSKSRKLHQLITEQEQSDKKSKPHEQEEEGENSYTPHIRLENFPGGPEIFEMVVKICYGVKVNLSASTAVLLRCAAEELEMTEEYSPDNLVSQTENFLKHAVFSNTGETIKALKACDSVSSLAESIGITKQCIDSILSRPSSPADPLFSWPINNKDSTKKQNKGSTLELLFEELSELSFPIFKRVVQAMKAKDLSENIVETSLIRYAKKHIPVITSRSSSSSPTIASENQQRQLLETIVSYLPIQTSTTRSLFGLLRSAIILNTSENCRTVLAKKIGSHLEETTLDDLLIPSYSYLNDTLYDIDLVERLIHHFLENVTVSSPSLTVVGKLIDGVLCEIASDANLKPERFYSLAVLLPDEGRIYDDGLYRAIDIYLKTHSWILEGEKEKICSVMDFQKLTIEGCTHAAQNERLPLRAVVKVLFLEQLQLRTLVTAVTEEDGGETAGGEKVEIKVLEEAVRENQVLRLDMDAMRTRLYHLEREYLNLKEVIAKIDKESAYVANDRAGKWSISKKFGCKFKTQVCDSHVATIVDKRCQRH